MTTKWKNIITEKSKPLDDSDLKVLNEAIPISAAKKYVKAFDRTRYNVWFKGEYRVYLKPEGTISTTNAVKPDPRVEKKLAELGYKIEDYLAGFAKKADGSSKNVQRIGAILSKAKDAETGRIFQMDPARGSQKPKESEFLVVISRHPYDIASMSAGRTWNSCMNVGYVHPTSDRAAGLRQEPGKPWVKVTPGCNARYVENDVRLGSLVAYWIKNDDKNIKMPISRLMIKPYFNERGESILICDNNFYPQGKRVPGFQETVIKWLDSVQGPAHGIFKRNTNLYNDHMPDQFERLSPEANQRNFELRDGLTWEIVMKNFGWLAVCKVQRAVIGITRTQQILWYNGDFKDGVWKEGEWHGGNFEGTWVNGTFKDGTFMAKAKWINGTFEGGNFSALFPRGKFKGGNFLGIMEGGEFHGGTFAGRYWHNGVFYGGTWEARCTFENGTWKNGIWKEGTFGQSREGVKAVWENGTFDNGNGHFMGKMLKGSIVNCQSIRDAEIDSATIVNAGTITGSIIKNAKVKSSSTADNHFHDCSIFGGKHQHNNYHGHCILQQGEYAFCAVEGPTIMNGGNWRGGDWNGGTWNSGTWVMGTWVSGTWKKGKWMAGTNPPAGVKVPQLDIERIKKLVKAVPYPETLLKRYPGQTHEEFMEALGLKLLEMDGVPTDKKEKNWRCKECGESNDPKLDQCYICGHVRGKMA